MQLAPQIPLTAQTFPYADGLRGVAQTLQVMRQLVRAGRVDPAIRRAATSITYLAPAKDETAELSALFEHVQSAIRYTRDVLDVETLSTAVKTLLGRVGDCDDQTVLLCALCEAVGYPTRFVVAGYDAPGVLEHVYCQVFANDQWIDCDPTEDYPMGWAPPDPVTIYVERI